MINADQVIEADVVYEYVNDTDYQDNGQVFVTVEIGGFSASAPFCKNENDDFISECGWTGDVEDVEVELGYEIEDLIDFDEIRIENTRGFTAHLTKIWDDLRELHKEDFKSDANFGCGCYFNYAGFKLKGDGFIRLCYKSKSDTLHYIDEDDHNELLEIEENFDYNDANRVLKVHALFDNSDD
jgi:hypothetical protein